SLCREEGVAAGDACPRPACTGAGRHIPAIIGPGNKTRCLYRRRRRREPCRGVDAIGRTAVWRFAHIDLQRNEAATPRPDQRRSEGADHLPARGRRGRWCNWGYDRKTNIGDPSIRAIVPVDLPPNE